MKLLKTLTVILSLFAVFSVATFSASLAAEYYPEVGDGYISFDFSKVQKGTVNGVNSANVEKNVIFDGVNTTKITPSPETGSGHNISIDSYSAVDAYTDKVDLTKYKYAGITYYYATDTPSYSGKSVLRLLSGTTKVISSPFEAESTDPLVTNRWAESYYIFGNELEISENATGTWLTQFHFRPFGGKNVFTLSKNDVIYISKITFYEENPDPDAKISMTYLKGSPDAEGDSIVSQVQYLADFILPECPFPYEGAVFGGWEYTANGQVYPAGTTFFADRKMTFIATWEAEKIYPDFISLDFTKHSNGALVETSSAFVTNELKDERTVVKAMPNTASGANYITLDSYTGYEKAGVDLGVYRWVYFEYYYDSETPLENILPRMSLLNREAAPVLTERIYLFAEGTLEAGTWSTMVFDMSILDSKLIEGLSEHPLHHIHLNPFGINIRPSSIPESDTIYISRIVFSKERLTPKNHEAYIKGYDDGTFRPSGNVTRAEACAMAARLIESEENISGTPGFSDVSSDEWYAKYIGFCEEKGLLKSYGSEFCPDEPVTRAEFSELVYLSVQEGHGTGNSLPDAASLLGEDGAARQNQLLTRADAAVIINSALARTVSKEALADDIAIIFLDVDDTHWAYADIAEAAVPHAEESGKWLYTKADTKALLLEKISDESAEKVYGLAAGRAKVAELDVLEEKRKAEIRSTPNMDITGFTEAVIYVSESLGNDENDGLSPEAPVKTLLRANELACAGGAVLLRRGDLWREKMSAKAGVTYSAYGEGAKPIIYGSPESGADPDKWKLVYENKDTGALIWEYQYSSEDIKNKFTDVGTIIFNGGEGYAMKEIPSCIGGVFVVREKPDKEFDYTVELDKNFEFFHAANSKVDNGYINISSARGPIYLRCDNGNPGKVFDSIEFVTRGANISVSSNNDVTIDNLCLMYGNFGISAGTQKNLTVSNCEIGWIGGSIQKYGKSETSGEYRVVRYGNGVEVYGGCDGYYIDNCYVYQCYDAGITHQLGSGSDINATQDNILYSNNLITDCVYNIEYFLGVSEANKYAIRTGNNVVFENNLLRRAGYGFGSFRPDAYNQRHIRSGSSRNEFKNYIIRNNIFDRAVHELVQTYTAYKSTAPKYEGNVYIQGVGNNLFRHSTSLSASTDIASLDSIKKILGDNFGQMYFVDYIPLYQFSYAPDKTVPVTDDDRS